MYLDLGGSLFWLLVWVGGLFALAGGDAKSPRRRIWLGWLVAPFVLFGLSLIPSMLSDAKVRRSIQEFEARYASFVRERQAMTLNAQAVVASDQPVTILVSYPAARLNEYGHPDEKSGLPAAAGIASDIADGHSPCNESRVREIQAVWLRGEVELLRRFGTCPKSFSEPEARPSDAEYELVLGQSYEEVRMPLPVHGLGTMTAFSAELRNRRTGEVLGHQWIFRVHPKTEGLRAAEPEAKLRLARLFASAFPRQTPATSGVKP